jgi:hypothetical protein
MPWGRNGVKVGTLQETFKPFKAGIKFRLEMLPDKIFTGEFDFLNRTLR